MNERVNALFDAVVANELLSEAIDQAERVLVALSDFHAERTKPCRACKDGFPLERDACPTCGRRRKVQT